MHLSGIHIYSRQDRERAQVLQMTMRGQELTGCTCQILVGSSVQCLEILSYFCLIFLKLADGTKKINREKGRRPHPSNDQQHVYTL